MASLPVFLLATLLAGCASVSDVRQLRYGIGAAEVVRRLGTPDERETAGNEEIWSYWVSGANCELTLRRGRLLAVPRCRTEEERNESQTKAEMRESWLSWKEAQAEEQYVWSAWREGRAVRAEQAERASAAAAAAQRKPAKAGVEAAGAAATTPQAAAQVSAPPPKAEPLKAGEQ